MTETCKMCGKQISKKNEDMCPKCKKKYLKENYGGRNNLQIGTRQGKRFF